MAQVRQPLPPQFPTVPNANRFPPTQNMAGPYRPPGGGPLQQPAQYPGAPPRPMMPQQNVSYPPPQISNHSSPQTNMRPPAPQMMNRPPPPTMSGQPSAQPMYRPPPPPPVMGGQPSAQAMYRPPPPPSSQMGGQPSAPLPYRMPVSQVGSQPPSQFASRRPSQVPSQPGAFHGSNNLGSDPLTGSIITAGLNNHGNFEHSQVMSPGTHRLPSGDQHMPPSVSNRVSPFQQQYQSGLPSAKFNERDASSGIRTVSDDDALSMASMSKKHLPVYARFPFDVSFLTRPVDMNVDDSVRDLRRQLIEAELNHQRRTTDEYIKQTHRLGLDTDHEIKSDLERELEIHKIQVSLNSGRRSQQPSSMSGRSYEPRAHLLPLNDILEERHFTSSNMDDLIDSMARRHLSDRLYVSADPRRSGYAGYNPSFGSASLQRRVPLPSQQRADDVYFTNTPPSSFLLSDFSRTSPSNSLDDTLRPERDTSSHKRPGFDSPDKSDPMRRDSSPKLPLISQGTNTNGFNQPQYVPNSMLYLTKHNLQGYRNYQQSVPLNLPDHTEHLIELPSDIFLTKRREELYTPLQRQKVRKGKQSKSRRRRSTPSEDSETESSGDDDDENNLFSDGHGRHRRKNRDDEQGFFTERNAPQRSKKKSKASHKLFRKAAIAVLFLKVLKHRVIKNRPNKARLTLSATIHKIRLQEIMVALHRVYLEPEGPIYNALMQATMSPVELKSALNSTSKHYAQAIYVIGDAVKNIIARIVDFMPKDGVLGTSQTSAIAALIQPGNPFPDNYFWQCERELLEFNKAKLAKITRQRAILLIIGSFIFRGLVTTLLTKPIKYRLLLGQLTPNQAASLKVLASVLFYIGRRAVKPSPQILPLPQEWNLSLHNDTSLKPIIQHGEIKPIITSCEQSLRAWCEQYIRRIDASFGKELRA